MTTSQAKTEILKATPPPPRPGRFGKISLLLALAAFIAGAASLTLFVGVGNESPEPLPTIATALFMTVFLLAAPLAHVVGLVIGLIAIFKHGESTLQGILGVVLNGLSVATGLLLIWAMLYAAAAFT